MSFSLGLTKQVRSNALIKFGSEIIGRIASFILVLWAAQQLGEAGFGLFNYGLALGFVLAQIADFGLQVLIAREIAVHDRAAKPLVLMGLRLKVLLSVPVILLMAVLTAGWPASMRFSLFWLGLTPLAQTYLEFVAYVFRGQQQLVTEAQLLTAARLLTAIIGGITLWLHGGLPGLALSSALSTGLLAIWSLWLLRKSGWLDNFTDIIDLNETKTEFSNGFRHYQSLLKQAWPIGISIFLSIAYTRLAILMLQYQAGEVAVARFSAAYRLVEPSQIVPASLVAAVFPAFTTLLHTHALQARQLGIRVSLLLAGGGSAAAAILWLGAPWIIPTLYGVDFVHSVPILQLLGLSTIPAFINYSLTHYLIARGQQLYIGLFTAAMLILHAILSWQLIPSIGAIGPAISIVVAENVLLLSCLLTLAFTRPRIAEQLTI